MTKTLAINRFTGIETRSSIGTEDHPLVNGTKAPLISDLNKVFFSDGVPLAVAAARKAIAEAGLDMSEITHLVSTTCTDSSNPGFDHYVLLHGVACSGGLATLRTAANLALGYSALNKPARILCLALEISTPLVRSELDSISDLQQTRVGVALFSDCGSALILSNGIGKLGRPVYELLGWTQNLIPDSDHDLGFDIDPHGWKVNLSQRVPELTSSAIPSAYQDLLATVPPISACSSAQDFDWAMHPGGASILAGVERVLGISPEHMRASYDRYIHHGNSSSASIFSVMDRLREIEMDKLAPGGRVRDHVVACAFGPGIMIEMCLLKRKAGVCS
ncbi:chalcone and stilbene synthase domain-containing [Fusarium albosuccineum]|uniref:Chalcone and stilbene synthase domain-containing n=1 Tax=Fusarium albosuccineum TaxID=1237068 RepID=A0A8H4LED7_9HYPO|nr:chalcone and stilbene synthase domain-containing [Fusarium albosuccineum]